MNYGKLTFVRNDCVYLYVRNTEFIKSHSLFTMIISRILLLLLFFPIPLQAQIEISGRIYDARTGETLPSATVILENTFRGTISNSEGYFLIPVETLPATLKISYIGYESTVVEIYDRNELPVSVRLSPSVTELDEIVVSEKDPGLTIMEYVIERKKLWRADLETYQSEAYTRQVLENDTSIVSITESNSILYWDKDDGYREIQTSARQTSNLDADQNFAGVRNLPNFYDDNIEIAGYNIVGITHPDALSYYDFSLMETLQMDGVPVYKIEVSPKRKLQPLFEGVAFVLGREYALIEVDLKPNEVVNFPPPVQGFDLSYSQQFNNYGGSFWLPVDMRINGMIMIGMMGLRFPSINFSQVSRISDYKANIVLPDSVFDSESEFIQADSASIGKETVSINQIPLTEEEKLAYESIDSTKTLEEAFKPEGFLARMIDDEGDEGGDSGLLGSLGELIPNGMEPVLRYNRTEGVHIGLSQIYRIRKAGLQTELKGGYSFNSETWDYGISVQQQITQFEDNQFLLHTGYRTGTEPRYKSGLYSRGMNSIATLIGGDDYFDYYRNHQFYGGLSVENLLPSVDIKFIGSYERHRSMPTGNELDFRLFGWVNERRPNPEINEGLLNSVILEIGYNVQDRNLGISGSRQIRVKSEISHPDLGSDFDFSSLSFSLDWNFETFYNRRLFANTLDLHLSGGTSFGSVPVQRLGLIDGSLSGFTPFGSLKTRNQLPYKGTRYWLAAAEHNFRTIPFEIIGLDYFVDKGWGIILFGGAGYTETDGNYPDYVITTNGIHTEAGISLNSIFGVFRLDFAKRMDTRGYFIGFSVPRYF